tara:strand:+ start:961 stop:1869 length:909 start_codon:yes stop_codon:yes gene_type:complete
MKKSKRKLSKKSKLFKKKSYKKICGGMGPYMSDEEHARMLQDIFDREQLSIGLQVSGDEHIAQQMHNDYLRENDIQSIDSPPAHLIEEEISATYPHILYRSLRPEEVFTLVNSGALLPPCTPCPEAGECCDITPGAHINSGSKANMKSSWISTTKSVVCAALWSSNRPSKDGEITRLPSDKLAKSSGIFAEIITKDLEMIDPAVLDLGVTAKNSAMASSETLIKNKIPMENISQLFMSQQVNKSEWEAYEGHKVSGKRTKSASKLYVIYYPLKGSTQWIGEMKKSAKESIQSKFESHGMEMD